MKLMVRTVSTPDLLDSATNVDPVLATDGWQTLMTITSESARKPPFSFFFFCVFTEPLAQSDDLRTRFGAAHGF